MVSLIEDSMPGKLRYVTKRNSRDDTATVTPFKEIDAKAKVCTWWLIFLKSLKQLILPESKAYKGVLTNTSSFLRGYE